MKTYIYQVNTSTKYFEIQDDGNIMASGYCAGNTYHAIYGEDSRRDIRMELGVIPTAGEKIKYSECVPSIQKFIRQAMSYARDNKKRQKENRAWCTTSYKSSPTRLTLN